MWEQKQKQLISGSVVLSSLEKCGIVVSSACSIAQNDAHIDTVVLLDEADVFLEERDVRDLNRNALVSVFLRALEYYEGILILTSNRVGTCMCSAILAPNGHC